MDTLRNAVKSFVDMKLVSYTNGGQVLSVEPGLIDVAESLTKFKRNDWNTLFIYSLVGDIYP